MSCILIILDGIGDRAYDSLGAKTPLEAAHTPYLDELSGLGANGLMHAGRYGQALTSENAHFNLFGYEWVDFPGRGYLEALGAGIKVGPSDVAILARIVSVEKKGKRLILTENWPKATSSEIEGVNEAICHFEDKDTEIEYVPTSKTQGIIVMRGKVSRFVTDSNPITENMPLMEPLPWHDKRNDALAVSAARALASYLRWCYRVLTNHPVNARRLEEGFPLLNAIATQRAGQMTEIPPFQQKWGLKSLSISSGLIYQGLAAFIAMDLYRVRDTDDPGADLAERLDAALSKTGEYDFIHVHTKAPDQASHTKNEMAKKEVIEKLDRGVGTIFNRLTADPKNLVVVTADHSTPCAEPMIHSGEPVPLTVWGRGQRRDRVSKFNEVDCASGSLGFLPGKDFMLFVLNALDRAKLSGLMDTPVDQPFWPGERKIMDF